MGEGVLGIRLATGKNARGALDQPLAEVFHKDAPLRATSSALAVCISLATTTP